MTEKITVLEAKGNHAAKQINDSDVNEFYTEDRWIASGLQQLGWKIDKKDRRRFNENGTSENFSTFDCSRW